MNGMDDGERQVTVRCAAPHCSASLQLAKATCALVDHRDPETLDHLERRFGWRVAEPLGLCCAEHTPARPAAVSVHCPDCGCVVADPGLHARWHEQLGYPRPESKASPRRG